MAFAVAPLHEPHRLRSILLELLGGSPQPAGVADLPASAWQELERMAGLHRLQPLLHHRHHANLAVPEDIRAGWHAAFRASAMASLVLAGELAATVRLLEGAGFAPLALKGAWLAWHAYPHPALRPMRDIDLLLSPETVIPAFDLLRANGFVSDAPQELTSEEIVRLDKHMPPLLSPRGVTIELHQRLWEIDGRMDHGAPVDVVPAIRARAIRIGQIGYLDPQDILAHLIIHAVYDHRLDCGPLVLSDIAFLLAAQAIDWGRFWHDARSGGWERGAQLVLSLVREYEPDLAISYPADLPPLPDEMAKIATDLLLQDLETRQSAGVVATLRAAGTKAFLLRILARRKDGDQHAVHRDLSSSHGFAAWAGSRLMRTVRELARRDVREQSRDLAGLSRWLDK